MTLLLIVAVTVGPILVLLAWEHFDRRPPNPGDRP